MLLPFFLSSSFILHSLNGCLQEHSFILPCLFLPLVGSSTWRFVNQVIKKKLAYGCDMFNHTIFVLEPAGCRVTKLWPWPTKAPLMICSFPCLAFVCDNPALSWCFLYLVIFQSKMYLRKTLLRSTPYVLKENAEIVITALWLFYTLSGRNSCFPCGLGFPIHFLSQEMADCEPWHAVCMNCLMFCFIMSFGTM